MKDPENGEEMKGGASEEEETGEETTKETIEESVEEAMEAVEEAAEAEGREGETVKEEGEEIAKEESEEAPGMPGPDKLGLSRPLIAGGIAVIVLSWVAIIVLAFLLATGDGNNTSGIDEMVHDYFQAIEENRQTDIYAMYSPDDLLSMAEMYGFEKTDDFLAYIEQNAGDESMQFDFEDITYEISFEDVAVVTITGGTVTMPDENGNPVTEEMASEVNPATIELIEIDGKWYLKMSGQ